MASIMLGGSISIKGLPSVVQEKLAELADAQTWFAIGDAPGCDVAFQHFLVKAKHPRVIVFTSMEQPRNNLGQWQSRLVESGLKSRGADMHTVKDRQMTQASDEGLFVWDFKSIGTLANIIDFIDQGKSCYIWTPKDDYLWLLDSPESLDKLTATVPQIRDEANKRLARYRKRELGQTTAEAPMSEQTLLFQ